MIEPHLIGYTEGGDHPVLDLEADGEGRYLEAGVGRRTRRR